MTGLDQSNYVMPFGKYKFTAIWRVPANYLIELYKDKPRMAQYPLVNEYIETNLSSLIPRSDGSFIKPIPAPICDKMPYADEESAKKALKLIKQDKRQHKKPIRAYRCEFCRYWHHTSRLDKYINSNNND